MPDLPTLAQTFRDAGYQATPWASCTSTPSATASALTTCCWTRRGAPSTACTDDYELFLGDAGFPGSHFDHGMSNNQYVTRPWHLPEATHVTNWATRQMARVIKRRDPTRPALWYLSLPPPPPAPGAPPGLPRPVPRRADRRPRLRGVGPGRRRPALRPPGPARTTPTPSPPPGSRAARRAFYALCTHIDHQLRVVVGALREEGLLDNTIVCFTADHGDMLGNHGLWAKRLFYEPSANVPDDPGRALPATRGWATTARTTAWSACTTSCPPCSTSAASPSPDRSRASRWSASAAGVPYLRRDRRGRQRDPHAARRPAQADLLPGGQPQSALRSGVRPAGARRPAGRPGGHPRGGSPPCATA